MNPNLLFWLLTILSASGFITYLVYSVLFYFGFKRYQACNDDQVKSVSVIIAAHNEEANLRKLLDSLTYQSYPIDCYEIIIADDDSDDNTAGVVEHYRSHHNQITYLKVVGREAVISPKKNAMEQAILIARGEIILTTDADCIVPHTWVEAMVQAFTDDVSLVAGYSRTYIEKWATASLLHRYEHFDFAATYMVLCGGYTTGRSFACIGQNLAYRKSAFYDVGGFEKIKHLISGDDVNLMQLMRLKGHKIIFNFNPKSFVYTHAIGSWKKLINQRTRWASNLKFQLRFNPEFFIILLSMAFMYWGSILMFVFNWKFALGMIGLRIMVENIFLFYSRRFFPIIDSRMHWFYPVWFLIQSFFLVFTMILGQFNLFVWHGRKPYRRRIKCT
ncbi:MAG: glycosyltransferase [Candidatus Cloacimonetes bacterium]|nr:glycosyltransferase [Candidatus Cloacimonadota bacterium]